MAIEHRIEGNILWITGKLDSSSAPELESAIAELTPNLTEQPPRAVLEFSGVRTLTSAPLRAMLTLAKRMRAAGGDVVVVAPAAAALEALKVSGFLRMQLFKTAGSLSELNTEQVPEPPPETKATIAPQKLRPLTVEQPGTKASPPDSLLSRMLKLLCFWKR